MIGQRRRARFCNEMCEDSFIEDRWAGAFYPAVFTPEGVYTHEKWSLRSLTCAYCRAEVPGRVIDEGPTWPPFFMVAPAQSYLSGELYLKVVRIIGPGPTEDEKDCLPVGLMGSYTVERGWTPEDAVTEALKVLHPQWKNAEVVYDV
jgi:hypothetical protein